MPRTQFAMPVLALAVLIPHAAMAVDATPDASQVVAAIEGAFGVTPGERRNHIKGTCALGEFVGTKEAAAYSRSELFSGKPVPVANATPVPHLSSPENLPPYTTTTAEGSQDTDQLSYLRDVWHAVQEREISPKQALVLLAQRPMDADAAPPAGMPAGPQAPVAAPAPAPEDPVG